MTRKFEQLEYRHVLQAFNMILEKELVIISQVRRNELWEIFINELKKNCSIVETQ